MKKVSLSIILMLVVILATIVPSYGSSHTFTLTVNPSSKTAKLGETVTFDIGIADIDQSTDGISAIEGMLKFDSDLFESIDINTESNWSVEINKTEGDPLKGKFVIARLGAVKETQVIARLHAKIRSDATVKSGTITLKDVFSSYNDGETDKTTKTITVNIAEEGGQDDDPVIIPDEPSTPDKSDTPSSTPSTPAQTTNTTTPKTNTSKASSLPKAGIIASGVGIAILAAIIVAIIELVKYKKIEK